MAIDSTELTFVRCPSCRSLVPAVSTRCRMCGASLDVAGSEGSQSEESKPQHESPEQEPVQAELEQAADESVLLEEEGSDPLSDYIDEVDVDDELLDDDDILSDDEFDELLDSILDPVEDSESAAGMEDPLEQPEAVTEMQASTNGNVEQLEPTAENAAESTPDLIIESGRRKPGQKSQLSFGAKDAEAELPIEQELGEVSEPIESVIDDANESIVSDSAMVEEKADLLVDIPVEDVEPVSVVEEVEVEQIVEELPKEEVPVVESPPQVAALSKAPAKKADQTGRLFGWLVSYSTPNGESIEIREGKFFITGKQIKGQDLVLDHASVSSPHAMVTISVSGGFRVQDLLSEEGIFIRTPGSTSYNKVDDLVTLENGMWVRFGDVEFLVSLIPYVGEK